MITKRLLHCGSFFTLNSFLAKNLLSVSASLKIHNLTEPDFVRNIRVRYNEDLLLLIVRDLQLFVGP
jgi:predicted thioredoxin/glutaredoxin